MLIFLDRQHAGKPNRLSDRGAGLDLNNNGLVDWWEKEAIWTGILSIELELLLLEMGCDVLPISDGPEDLPLLLAGLIQHGERLVAVDGDDDMVVALLLRRLVFDFHPIP